MDQPVGERDSVDLLAADTSNRGSYFHLCHRAKTYVGDRGGAVSEDALIRHVFGNSGSTALWRPLLRRVLGSDDRLVLRADGYWAAHDGEHRAADALLTECVVLDVETTGLRPGRHRIIEVAAILLRDGVEVSRVETVCNPGRQLPKYIVDLTGIRDADLVAAPSFGEIVEPLLELLESVIIVGHNVGFDIGFVDAELRRLGRPPLVNERIDTMSIAVALLPNVRKPNLASIARELGVPTSARALHRAGSDAELTAEVLAQLVRRASEGGVCSIDALKAIGTARKRGQKDSVGRGRAVLDRSLVQDIPAAPGVYIMRDTYDHVIYVGKAKNLRERVRSYYSEPLGYTRKMDGLLEAIARIDVEVVGSELAALILESQLIKRYQPRFNTALRSSELYPYIRVDIANPWPRLTLAKVRKHDGARYFGPFRNTSGARKTVDLINRIVPLRTCTRSFKTARSYGSPCLELDLRRCLGPCVGKADRSHYVGLVNSVVSFLDGRDDALYELLWHDLEVAAAKLDFERAARLRRDLLQVNAVVSAQRRLREAEEFHTVLLVMPGVGDDARELYLVVHGQLWARFAFDRGADANQLIERLTASWTRMISSAASPIDHGSLDENSIVQRWLFEYSGHPAIVPLPRPPANPEWESIVERVRALRSADLIFAMRKSETELESDSSGQVPDPPMVEDDILVENQMAPINSALLSTGVDSASEMGQ